MEWVRKSCGVFTLAAFPTEQPIQAETEASSSFVRIGSLPAERLSNGDALDVVGVLSDQLAEIVVNLYPWSAMISNSP